MAIEIKLTRDDLRQLGRLGEKELKRELVFQKHVASSELFDSINHKVISTSNGVKVGFYLEEYGIFVDKGRTPGGKKVPIAALLEWVKIKGFTNDDKEAKSIAFAVQTKIFQDGIPTSRSRRIASRRTGFIKQVQENIESEAREIILTKAQDNVRSQLSSWFRQAQQELDRL